MRNHWMNGALAAAVLATVAISAATPSARAEDGPNAAPNPYRTEEGWAKLPEGRKWGMTIGLEIDRDGKSCGCSTAAAAKTCAGSPLKPIQKFDAAGNLLASFGAGMFVFPHGLYRRHATTMSGRPTARARTARATPSSSSARTARC